MRRLLRWVRRKRWTVKSRTVRAIAYLGGALVCFLIVADMAVGILPWRWGQGALMPRTPTPVAVVTVAPAQLSDDQAMALVYAYNQAMQDFVLTLNPWSVQPFVHPEGPLWAETQELAAERQATGEIHYVVLQRFGVSEVIPGKDEVVVHAAEIWDDEAVDSQRNVVLYSVTGVTQEVLYRLRPVAGTDTWLIWSQEVVRVVGLPGAAATPTATGEPQE